MDTESEIASSGMELRDLLEDRQFASRRRDRRDSNQKIEALGRLAHVFAEKPEIVIQELVEIAVRYCGADSAGVSLEEVDESGERRFRWVAISGTFARYLNGTTPRFFSPCGTCLSSGRAQLYRVTKPYYDFLGVTADEITDGMLIPWISEYMRGTIWAIGHHSREAFDLEDYKLLDGLADFASIALRHQYQQQVLREREREAASAARANELAHLINNPLQSLTNTIYLARKSGDNAQEYLEQASEELDVLSRLVSKLLTFGNRRENRNPDGG